MQKKREMSSVPFDPEFMNKWLQLYIKKKKLKELIAQFSKPVFSYTNNYGLVLIPYISVGF